MTRARLFAICAALAPIGLGAALQDKPQVVMETSEGTIVLELDPAKAPATVENFLKYVDAGHYNGTVFHRVIDGFMIQGGGFDEKYQEKKTGAPVKNESKARNPEALGNARGTIAMARTSQPDSATAQFYINTGNNANLDTAGGGYTAFGKVVQGQEVVDKIGKAPTGSQPVMAMGPGGALENAVFQDVPKNKVVIKSVKKK